MNREWNSAGCTPFPLRLSFHVCQLLDEALAVPEDLSRLHVDRHPFRHGGAFPVKADGLEFRSGDSPNQIEHAQSVFGRNVPVANKVLVDRIMKIRVLIVLVGWSSHDKTTRQILNDLHHIVIVMGKMVFRHIGGNGIGDGDSTAHDKIITGGLGQ